MVELADFREPLELVFDRPGLTVARPFAPTSCPRCKRLVLAAIVGDQVVVFDPVPEIRGCYLAVLRRVGADQLGQCFAANDGGAHSCPARLSAGRAHELAAKAETDPELERLFWYRLPVADYSLVQSIIRRIRRAHDAAAGRSAVRAGRAPGNGATGQGAALPGPSGGAS